MIEVGYLGLPTQEIPGIQDEKASENGQSRVSAHEACEGIISFHGRNGGTSRALACSGGGGDDCGLGAVEQLAR